jgi:hypothetical protein
MPQYFGKMLDNLAAMRHQLDEITGSSDKTKNGIVDLLKEIASSKDSVEQITSLETAMDKIASLVGKTNALYKANDVIRHARDNQQLTQSYRDQWKILSQLETNVGYYSSRIAALHQAQSDLQGDDFESWYKIEEAVELLQSEEDKARDGIDQARTSIIAINDASLQAALAGQKVLYQWEGLGDEFNKFKTSFPTRLFVDAVDYSGKLNASIIQANVSTDTRNRLYHESVNAAAKLGLSLESVTRAQTELVNRGYDLRGIDKTRLETVLKLETAVGAEVSTSVELLSISRGIGANFDIVANHVAKIVDDTSVAADEAERYAVSLAKVALVSNQRGNQLGVATELAARVEDLLKQHGLDSGKFIQLVQRANTLEGLGTSLVHGGGLMDMLQSPESMSRFILGLTRRAAEFGPGAGGAMARNTYAESLGIDPELFADMYRNQQQYVDIANNLLKTQSNGGELQKRWTRQIGAMQGSINQLVTSFKNLAQLGLEPVVDLVSRLSRGLASVFNFFSSFLSGDYVKSMHDGLAKTVASIVQGAVSIGFKIGFPVTVMALLSRGIISLTRRSYELATSLLRLGGVMSSMSKVSGQASTPGGGMTTYSRTARGFAIGTGAIVATQLINDAVQRSTASDTTKSLVDSTTMWADVAIAFVTVFKKWTLNILTKAGSLVKNLLPKVTSLVSEGGLMSRMTSTLGRVGGPVAVLTLLAALIGHQFTDFFKGYNANNARNDLLLDRAPTQAERLNNGFITSGGRKELREINLNRQLRPAREQLEIYTGKQHDEAVQMAFNQGWENYMKFVMTEHRKMLVLIDNISHINDDKVREIVDRVNKQASDDKLAGFKMLDMAAQRSMVAGIRAATGRLTQPKTGMPLAKNNPYGSYEDVGNGRSISRPSYYIQGGKAQTDALIEAYKDSKLKPREVETWQPVMPTVNVNVAPAQPAAIQPPVPIQPPSDERVTAAINMMNKSIVNAVGRLHALESEHWQSNADSQRNRDINSTLLNGNFA